MEHILHAGSDSSLTYHINSGGEGMRGEGNDRGGGEL